MKIADYLRTATTDMQFSYRYGRVLAKIRKKLDHHDEQANFRLLPHERASLSIAIVAWILNTDMGE